MSKEKKKPKIVMPKEFREEKRGLVLCYIGDGKGKTTAAMGVAVRAAGAGLKVYILQFVKAKAKSKDQIKEGEWPVSNEINFFNHITTHGNVGTIENEQLGLGFVGILGDKKEKEAHIKAALDGLNRAKEIIHSGKYDVVVLDEIVSAVEVKVLTEDDVAEVLKNKPNNVHLIITGHNKFPKILKECDLVTRMEMIQHPYYKGILAQEGIDY
jgi:cob(I)alamin adenosyltransferase